MEYEINNNKYNYGGKFENVLFFLFNEIKFIYVF